MNQSGQISIEFLLLLCALIVFFSVFISAIPGLKDYSFFAIDVKNAVSFSSELSNESEFLLLVGEGSESEIKVNILTNWIFEKNSSGNFLKVKMGEKEKSISLPDLEIKLKNNFYSGKNIFVLTRTSKGLVLANRNF